MQPKQFLTLVEIAWDLWLPPTLLQTGTGVFHIVNEQRTGS